jgi:hypothetical protein
MYPFTHPDRCTPSGTAIRGVADPEWLYLNDVGGELAEPQRVEVACMKLHWPKYVVTPFVSDPRWVSLIMRARPSQCRRGWSPGQRSASDGTLYLSIGSTWL